MRCHACYHGDCPHKCPDDMCRGSCECECDDFEEADDMDDTTEAMSIPSEAAIQAAIDGLGLYTEVHGGVLQVDGFARDVVTVALRAAYAVDVEPLFARAEAAERERDEATEPGKLIAKVDCPKCGTELQIEHGDEPGEVGILA